MSPEQIDPKPYAVSRRTTLRITTSGYDDRFVMGNTEVWFTDEQSGFALAARSQQAAIVAAERLLGLGADEATRLVTYDSPHEEWISAELPDGSTLTFVTKKSRIEAGIAAATGYPRLREAAVEARRTLAATLSRDEWDAVYSGLEACNRENARKGRTVVEFVRTYAA
jgi:hypothetical protein